MMFPNVVEVEGKWIHLKLKLTQQKEYMGNMECGEVGKWGNGEVGMWGCERTMGMAINTMWKLIALVVQPYNNMRLLRVES